MPSAIARYVSSLRAERLNFQALAPLQLDAGRLYRYQLQSQHWPPGPEAQPWQHQLDLLIPHQETPGPALLLANNRSPYPLPSAAEASAHDVDFNARSIERLATHYRCRVLSVAQLPNQPLRLPGHAEALNEDWLVAASWQAYMRSQPADPRLPLQVPMTAALIRALDLYQLQHGLRHGAVVAGISKRAGAAWLSALNDSRLVALVSMGLDIHFQATLGHIEQVYHGHWPEALAPYVATGIAQHYRSPDFQRLMHIIDPWSQRLLPQGRRLRIPKWIVNASGDDFFPVDGPALYLPHLPPPYGLQTLPNCDHAGIRQHVVSSLGPFLGRIRSGQALPPSCTASHEPPLHIGQTPPTHSLRWHAHNPKAQDFRYRQGIRYHPEMADCKTDHLAPGWHAQYLEQHYADGLCLCSPVQIRYQA